MVLLSTRILTTITVQLLSYSVHEGKHFLFQLWVDFFLSWFTTGLVQLFISWSWCYNFFGGIKKLNKVCCDDWTSTKMLIQCYFNLTYSWCFSQGRNLDFLDFLQKKFYHIISCCKSSPWASLDPGPSSWGRQCRSVRRPSCRLCGSRSTWRRVPSRLNAKYR